MLRMFNVRSLSLIYLTEGGIPLAYSIVSRLLNHYLVIYQTVNYCVTIDACFVRWV